MVYRASLLRKWGVKPPEVRILSSPQTYVANAYAFATFTFERDERIRKAFVTDCKRSAAICQKGRLKL